jgi:hypothetical protein
VHGARPRADLASATTLSQSKARGLNQNGVNSLSARVREGRRARGLAGCADHAAMVIHPGQVTTPKGTSDE